MARASRGGGRRSGGSGVDWFPVTGSSGTVLDGLAAGGQATVFDQPIQSPITGASYDQGALVGLRMWMVLYPGAATQTGIKLICMVLPNGAAVPTVNSALLQKNNENYIWFVGLSYGDLLGGTGNAGQLFATALASSRKFPVGGRLVVVAWNDSAVAFHATGTYVSWVVDCYVREE